MKLIAIDVDGTLIPYGAREISRANREAIKKASIHNYISLCTGRCHREAEDIISALELDNNYHILGGGGLIRRNNGFSTLGSLSNNHIDAVLSELECFDIFKRRMALSSTSGCWELLHEEIETPMISIELDAWNDKAIEAEKSLQNKFPELLITHVLGHEYGEWWLQISSKYIHKGAGLLYVSEKINPKETIAFGDALNDIELFMNANISVAMSDAPKELKAHATYEITSSADAIAHGLSMLEII